MLATKLCWSAFSDRPVPPRLVFYAMRATMWACSVWLGDAAFVRLAGLLPGATRRGVRLALLLYASSWTTLVIQTHTFSNSVESIIVLWCALLSERILGGTNVSSRTVPFSLGVLAAFGVFNRITLPAFLLVHGVLLLISMWRNRRRVAPRRHCTSADRTCYRIRSFLHIALGVPFASLILICIDFSFYRQLVVTPLNFARYNSDSANLAKHGLHPRWLHLLVNLPQLVGPALLRLKMNRFASAGLAGVAGLSLFPHQEARFLLPAVPLLLLGVDTGGRAPGHRLTRAASPSRQTRVALWIAFNAAAALVYGTLHQAGVFPAQWFLQSRHSSLAPGGTRWQAAMPNADWWRVYDPPLWMGPSDELHTGIRRDNSTATVQEIIRGRLWSMCSQPTLPVADAYLVTPRSNVDLARFDLSGIAEAPSDQHHQGHLELLWSTRWHLSLDDIGSNGETPFQGIWRIITHPGLDVWRVVADCDEGNPLADA